MNWQMIDNIASTISSAVTVGGVIFGVFFGKRKVNEWLSIKNRDKSHESAVKFMENLDRYLSSLQSLKRYIDDFSRESVGLDIGQQYRHSLTTINFVKSYYGELLISYDSLSLWGVTLTPQVQSHFDKIKKIGREFECKEFSKSNVDRQLPSFRLTAESLINEIDAFKNVPFGNGFSFN
ncbi:hypothetical protein ACV8TY_16205 [Citrobacter freundii]|uniref:Uncharacterized protein n=1 Tax=Citrobacter freundii TaxID=546 RepID=A0AAP9TVC7_CITFR|nr:hypothetical protein [Citrobacter freundii]ELO3996564.1 hypothetical protein [Citrobacter freundii]NTY49245.1 hypothetical protein [Citrobacter freundii]QLV30296.1 hypothetical protein HV178_09990 [Citrobacter freundii]QLW83646.1 hypothetical protein HV151_09430 [Citrobacter freundii]HAT7528008.1 hypothetical protein [Citrobacter freundii]